MLEAYGTKMQVGEPNIGHAAAAVVAVAAAATASTSLNGSARRFFEGDLVLVVSVILRMHANRGTASDGRGCGAS